MDNLFNVGEVYKRSHIHDTYGGQRQGGISTPVKYPIILLFTGKMVKNTVIEMAGKEKHSSIQEKGKAAIWN